MTEKERRAITCECPCGQRFRLAGDDAGRRIRCPACARVLTLSPKAGATQAPRLARPPVSVRREDRPPRRRKDGGWWKGFLVGAAVLVCTVTLGMLLSRRPGAQAPRRTTDEPPSVRADRQPPEPPPAPWARGASSQNTGTQAGTGDSHRTVFIDAAWLADRGPGPYLLDRPGTTYVLRTDVRAEGTAFVIGAVDVVLDLGGHTVVYGDADPLAVANGGFEEGSSRSVPGWDLGGAPAARLAPNTSYLFGSRVLRLSSFRTPQRLLSDPVALHQAGRGHAATITPAGPDSPCTLTLLVLDTVTGQMLGRGTSSSVSRGLSAVARFTPSAANPVRLQVDVTPLRGATASVDLDGATLAVEGDCGILASRVWDGELPAWGSLPRPVQAAYRKKAVARFTLRNGRVLQGRGGGHASPPLFFRDLPGVTVEGVETYATGMDTETLDASGANGPVTVVGSTFRQDIGNISHRMRCFATVKLNNVRGPIVVEGNRLLGSPQVGIMLGRNNPRHAVRVCRNEFRQNAVVTNGYAVLCSGVQNFEIADNVVCPVSGKGFCLDSYTGALLGHGEVRGNRVEVRERPNREYPAGLVATALRLRNVADRGGPQRDVKIHGNTFAASCGPGLTRAAYTVRVSYANQGGAMDDAGIALVNNTIRAVTESGDPSYRARALVLDRLDAGINLVIESNVLESNDVSLGLADATGGVNGATLISNTLRKSSAGAGRSYTGVRAGHYNREVRGVRLVDTRCEGGATAGIAWGGTAVKEVQVGRLLDVKVLDGAGNPLPGATVRLCDRDGRDVGSGRAGPGGLARCVVISAVHRQGPSAARPATQEQLGPYQILAVYEGRTAAAQADLVGSTLVLRIP